MICFLGSFIIAVTQRQLEAMSVQKKNAPPWQDILSQNHTHTHLSVGYEAREFLVGRKSMEELPRASLTTNDRRYTNSETLDC